MRLATVGHALNNIHAVHAVFFSITNSTTRTDVLAGDQCDEILVSFLVLTVQITNPNLVI